MRAKEQLEQAFKQIRNIILRHRKHKRQVRTVAATIEFHHLEEGRLWTDWTNELGSGQRKVWKTLIQAKQDAVKIGETGREETVGNMKLGKTIQSQIFTTYFLQLTSLAPPKSTFEPYDPWNRLGVRKLVKLNKGVKK